MTRNSFSEFGRKLIMLVGLSSFAIIGMELVSKYFGNSPVTDMLVKAKRALIIIYS